MTIIGIDLGTTNSAVAYLKDGKPQIIENRHGERTTPSVFQIDRKGEIKVGPIAKDEYPSYPKETVLEIKRLMGKDEKVHVSGKEYRPEEISAHILKYMKSSAEEKLGVTVSEAVITVPAYFSDSQRKATQKAGELAGLKVERIINEPTAAAIAFGIENMNQDQNILVYDLGGGTFDVSVVELFDGVVEVRASAGNNNLGGMDFDNALVDWVVDEFKKEKGIDLLQLGSEDEILQRKARIKVEAEKTKKTLSTQNSAKINLPFIAIDNNMPISIDYEITRAQFEKLIKEMAESTLKEVDKALNDAKLSEADIQEVLLVGGSTRIPLIQELVEKKFKKAPRKDINPDEAIALGAAVQAAIKSGELDSKDGLMVIDVCPYTLGTEVVRYVGGQAVPGFFDPIIPRNSTVPITESKIYSTVYDDQDEVKVRVYQGDDEDQYVRPDKLISEDLVLTGIPSRPAGEENIEIKFSYDINGLLQVEATILSTGKKISKAIGTQVGVMTDQEVAASTERIEQEWNQSELYNEVKNVINRAEKMMDEVEAKDREKIEKLLSNLKDALNRNDTIAVKKLEDELTDLLIELV